VSDGPGAPVRVLVVDDDPLVRTALALVFGGGDGVVVVAEAGDGAEAATLADLHQPDVVLMDIRMPRVDGLTATETLRAQANPPEVIVLTTFDADEHVLRALRAGASGFLLKDTPPAQIIGAVRRVAAGDPILSPAVLRRLMTHAATTLPAASAASEPAPSPPGSASSASSASTRTVTPAPGRPSTQAQQARAALERLSERERDVALAVGRGLSNAQIAAELYMSVATVKSYVSKLFVRLGLDNRVQIALLVHDADL